MWVCYYGTIKYFALFLNKFRRMSLSDCYFITSLVGIFAQKLSRRTYLNGDIQDQASGSESNVHDKFPLPSARFGLNSDNAMD